MDDFFDTLGIYFYDSVEVLLDALMLFLQIPMSWGIYVLTWFDGALPGGHDWSSFWSSMPVELINLGLYVGLWECLQIMVTMLGMKAVYNIVRGR